MQRLGLQAPVVGFLMQRALLLSGSTVSFAGWTKPVAEPEIGVRMARDLPAARRRTRALAAVKEILPAIELADFDPPPTPDNLDAVLAGNIYQRHVVLCGNTRPGGGLAGLTSRVIRRGAEAARTTDLEALTGKLPDIVAHVANTLAAYRRETVGRRRHHYRLDHAADHDRGRRDRIVPRARSDRHGFGEIRPRLRRNRPRQIATVALSDGKPNRSRHGPRRFLFDRPRRPRPRQGRQLLERGLDGADDGELFLEYAQSEALVFDNGRLKQATYDTAQGFGLRAVKDEAVGYAHASDLSEAALARAAEAVRAVKGGHSGTYAEPPGRTNRKLYGDDNPLGAAGLRRQGETAGRRSTPMRAPRIRACAR